MHASCFCAFTGLFWCTVHGNPPPPKKRSNRRKGRDDDERGGRLEGKVSKDHPRGTGFTQTGTIYPKPFYFYPHMHPFYTAPSGLPRTQTEAVTVDVGRRAWLAQEESSSWRTVMWRPGRPGEQRNRRAGERGVKREGSRCVCCHPVTPSAGTGHNTSRRTSAPAQVCSHNRPAAADPDPFPILQCLVIGRPWCIEEKHGNQVTVTTDNPHLRPVTVTQHHRLIINSCCLFLCMHTAQPRGTVVLHYTDAWFNQIWWHRPLNAWFQQVRAMKTCWGGVKGHNCDFLHLARASGSRLRIKTQRCSVDNGCDVILH